MFAIGGGAFSNDFQASFTYTVAPEDTFTSTLVGQLTGTELTGDRAHQTFTIDNFPLFTGQISRDDKSLTIAHEEPTVETVKFFTGSDPTPTLVQ